MTDLLQVVEAALRDRCEISAPETLVVGVSGGPDSLCLMHVLHSLGHRLVIAHLDHQLREEAQDEAASVRRAAAALSLEYVEERADVRGYAASGHLSLEEAAREVRYQFLFQQARRHDARAVAVGHTADDQVETVLMHLIRGAGVAGLKGMTYRTALAAFDPSIPLIRPLLGTWRRQTLEYCEMSSLIPVKDRSNESREFLRNRVRLDLIPSLETYNPKIREAIWRTAQVLAADLTLVEERIGAAWQSSILREGRDLIAFDAESFMAQSTPVRRRLILKAAARLMPAADIGFANIERAADLAAEAPSGIDLGCGLHISREGGAVYVGRGPLSLPAMDFPQMDADPIALPSRRPLTVDLANGWKFEVDYPVVAFALVDPRSATADAYRVILDADALPAQLELRPPRPGDRLQPLGLGGHSQKLSDLFVNAKTPKRTRARWPLLCSGDTLVWVPGHRPSEVFKFSKETKRIACFTLSRPGHHVPITRLPPIGAT